jgi:hypothetical protein
MAKQRIHNEWFRPVAIRSVKVMRTRDAALIDEILSRPDCRLTREQLEQPYESYAGYESSRKSCKTCGAKLINGETMWSWGEYHNVKWRTIKHFCKECYESEVLSALIEHRNECGCDFQLIGKSSSLPKWLRIPECQVQEQQ